MIFMSCYSGSRDRLFPVASSCLESQLDCFNELSALSCLQIYPDNFAKREILQLTVHCRNFKTHGCEWLGTLKDLKVFYSDS